ncbi:MAG: hypothetical protein MUF87_05775 [Anaerolineae bacterium]|jgi:hypothetical protein|nr:hypothetical protein [Anaerolineae bacterium]
MTIASIRQNLFKNTLDVVLFIAACGVIIVILYYLFSLPDEDTRFRVANAIFIPLCLIIAVAAAFGEIDTLRERVISVVTLVVVLGFTLNSSSTPPCCPPTPTPVETATSIPSATHLPTVTPSATLTHTLTPSATATIPTATSTPTITPTPTPTPRCSVYLIITQLDYLYNEQGVRVLLPSELILVNATPLQVIYISPDRNWLWIAVNGFQGWISETFVSTPTVCKDGMPIPISPSNLNTPEN